MEIRDLINREVCVNGKEGEIVDIIGVNSVKVEFFNLNYGKCIIPVDEIEEYLV